MSMSQSSISGLKEKVDLWRLSKKSVCASMPKELWDEAAHLARIHGHRNVAKKVGLDSGRVQHFASLGELKTRPFRAAEISEAVKFSEVRLTSHPAPVEHYPTASLELPNGSRLTLYQALGVAEVSEMVRLMSFGGQR